MEYQKTLTIYKPVGYTPYQIISLLKEKCAEFKDTKIGYAGRLDPMAEGLLLLLIGEENKNKASYENLDKTYEFKILFGFATDTYDLMGIITDKKLEYELEEVDVKKVLPSFIGKFEQPYPPYSSAAVQGKPLFYWAKHNKLNEIKIPTKHVEVYDIEFLKSDFISSLELLEKIKNRISLVSGDFRQTEIIKHWDNILQYNDSKFVEITLKTNCSSGTYVRHLANQFGINLSIPALASEIKRTKIGNFELNTAMETFYRLP